MSKLAIRINNKLDEDIRLSLPKALTEKFGELEFETSFNMFAMALTTSWKDGSDE